MFADEARLKKKFGGMWHRSMSIKDPHLADMCHCCFEPPTQRIEVNIWGTVYEYDVCDQHAEYDGKACDDIPLRRSFCVIRRQGSKEHVSYHLDVTHTDGSFETIDLTKAVADALTNSGVRLTL